MKNTKFNGLTLAIQTPFKADGAIDFDCYQELLARYLDTGIDAVLVSSGTGQHVYLTEQETYQLLDLTVSNNRSQARILFQTSALNQQEVVRRSVTAQEKGADGVMILPPFFEGPADNDGIVAFYQVVSEAISIEIIGYNVPAATGIEITPDLFSRLLHLENFTSVKDSSGDLGKQQMLMPIGPVINGADTLVPYSLYAGATGLIWGGANYMPLEAVQLLALIRSGDYAQAQELWQRIFPVMAYTWNNDYIPCVNAACRIMGYDGGTVRVPVREISEQTLQGLKSALEPLMS